ncbi:hypothetical protein [Herbiconiux sp. L3-i23]|uniref:hypothetical protein n=1 Tax=Herbiconiux sp. L3-i23 TaxID=2905871 RepID=UPI002050AAC8|nr:hypothetical protein [Herbiconiux sp. L3-i23]BDI22056.1 hypothetical protein L3i23_08320 [Herbiconiux sp. L3-i23]
MDCGSLFGSALDVFGPMTWSGDDPAASSVTLADHYDVSVAAEAQAGLLTCMLVGGAGREVRFSVVPGAGEAGRPLLGERVSGDIRTTDQSTLGCTRFTPDSYACSGSYIDGGDWIRISYRGGAEDPYSAGDELVSAALDRLRSLPEQTWQRPSSAWADISSCDAVDPEGAAATAAALPGAPSSTAPRGMEPEQQVAYATQGALFCAEGDTLADEATFVWFELVPGGSWVDTVTPTGQGVEDAEVEGALAARWVTIMNVGDELPEGGPTATLDVFTDGGWLRVGGIESGVPLDKARIQAAAEVLLERIAAP